MLSGDRSAARKIVASTIGVMRARDLRMRVRHVPGAPSVATAEECEVRRARRERRTSPPALVTTVVPTYERGVLAAEAVESALSQTITDHIVVVVVDGGSAPPLKRHPRLHVVALSRHRGIPGLVRNVGIRTSDSPFLAFLDDDNTWEPNHLEVSLAAHRAGAQLTYTGLRQVRPDGSEGNVIAVPFDRGTLRNHSYIDTSTMVVRRSPAVRFSWTARGGRGGYEDWNLAFRLSRRLRTELVSEVTVRYLLHPDGYMQRHVGRE